MKIEGILVSNFKALNDHLINFKDITVLAGGNSVGKSTTIQCLLLVRSLVEKIYSKNLQNSSAEIVIPLNGPYLLSLGSTKEVISWESGKQFSITILCNDIKLRFDFEADDLEESNFFIKATFPKINNTNLRILLEDFYYLNAERLGPRISHIINENPSNITCGFQGQYAIEVLARMGDNTEIISPNKFLKGNRLPGLQSLSRYTKQWLNFIIPDVEIDNAIIFGNIRSASVKFNSFFSPPNVGFGISYVLPIIVTGLIASENSILLIENPEAHLHPKGQSRIGYFLGCMAAAGVQVFVETHSEHVVNGIRLASVELKDKLSFSVLINFYTKNTDKNVNITEVFLDKYGDLSDFPYDFFDQSQQDLLEIMQLTRQ